MIVLITGATGFIGRRLSTRLGADGIHVRATFRREPPFAGPGIEWVAVENMHDPAGWDRLLRDVEVVVHLAGLAHQIGRSAAALADEFRRTNVEATEVLTCACARANVRRLIFMSSIAAALVPSGVQGELADGGGSQPDARRERADAMDYGRSKLEAERSIERLLAPTAVDWCILRPPLVYGPDNPGNMARLLRLIRTGLPLPLASIRNRRSFVFVDNLVDAVATVVRHSNTIRATFAVTDATDLSTPELVESIANYCGKRVRLIRVPVVGLRLLGRTADMVGAVLGRALPFDSYSISRLTESLHVDGSRFREAFCWSPPIDPRRALEITCAGMAAAG